MTLPTSTCIHQQPPFAIAKTRQLHLSLSNQQTLQAKPSKHKLKTRTKLQYPQLLLIIFSSSPLKATKEPCNLLSNLGKSYTSLLRHFRSTSSITALPSLPLHKLRRFVLPEHLLETLPKELLCC